MSKRRLSEQQKRRISKRQATLAQDHSDLELGLVIANLGETIEVETDQKTILKCIVRQNIDTLVPGDQVYYADDTAHPGHGFIEALLPRQSVLKRPDKYKQSKTIAANIDQLFITLAITPEPIDYYIDQYLVAAELNHINAILLLNKIDLTIPAETQKLLARYQALGYEILSVSAHKNHGLDPLNAAMKNKTSIFVGQSGVGKSALINAVMGAELTKTGEVSQANLRGQHTTTTSRLYHLPNGGNLIDSPGIREFGLWHLEPDEVLTGFKELSELATQCQFRNCAHREGAKGCAIRKALDNREINSERLKNYYRILDQ